MRVRLDSSQILTKYFLYYFQSPQFNGRVLSKSFGAAIKNMFATKELKKFRMILPSISVQKEIVSKLDQQMAQIEIMKKEAEKEEEAVDQYYESLLKNLFNDINLKRSKIKDLCVINPRKPELKCNDEAETSFIPMEAVNQDKGIIEKLQIKPFGRIKKGYTYFEEGDVLFAKITPCMQNKKSAIARNLINRFGFGTTEWHVLRANSKILPELLLHIIRQSDFIEKAKANFTGSVGQQRVPKEFIEEYEAFYPEKKEDQLKMLNNIEKVSVQIDEIKSKMDGKLLAISQLPSAILNEVFGKYSIGENGN
jgi:type I restriction enzyme S subunit